MKISHETGASKTILFAAEELGGYLRRMVKELLEGEFEIRLTDDSEVFPTESNDSFRVQIGKNGGCITGNNDRSVLLAVYDYLHYLGCRFLLPEKKYEIVPIIEKEKMEASYEKRASFYYRGVCIEGADSFENIMNYIEWMPKVGFNSFFLQFKSPYAFLERWYSHLENPYAEAENYTPEDAQSDMKHFEREIKKRGLMLHKAGHGWTGEALGYQTVSWNVESAEKNGQLTHRMAMLNGKRDLYGGVPANTNLCYSNADAIETFVNLVVDYAKENPDMDYLHVWLADEYNNLCECDDCSRTTLSDQYVELLNEIDKRLTEEGLDTHIVFLLYQELLWPPVVKRLHHPERFVLMFAPISRTFEKSYELGGIKTSIPVFKRNHNTLPTNLSENIAFLRGWQKIFKGESFVYDYPLGRAHYGDFGYVHIARVIYSDIQKLEQMGLNGYISCQELRAALPNALPNYVMAYTLFQKETEEQELIKEYFSGCYGESWESVLAYLTELSRLSSCDYINGKGERCSQDIAGRMESISRCCLAFEEEIRKHRDEKDGWENGFWEILEYHRNYIILFSKALRELALGNEKQAYLNWKAMREFICRNEEKYQPFLDVYRILEVTRKYTKIREPQEI